MGNNIDKFCNCKEIKDAFNPELEDVKILFLYKITYIGLQ
jgi:hypothetical protein